MCIKKERGRERGKKEDREKERAKRTTKQYVVMDVHTETYLVAEPRPEPGLCPFIMPWPPAAMCLSRAHADSHSRLKQKGSIAAPSHPLYIVSTVVLGLREDARD